MLKMKILEKKYLSNRCELTLTLITSHSYFQSEML